MSTTTRRRPTSRRWIGSLLWLLGDLVLGAVAWLANLSWVCTSSRPGWCSPAVGLAGVMLAGLGTVLLLLGALCLALRRHGLAQSLFAVAAVGFAAALLIGLAA